MASAPEAAAEAADTGSAAESDPNPAAAAAVSRGQSAGVPSTMHGAAVAGNAAGEDSGLSTQQVLPESPEDGHAALAAAAAAAAIAVAAAEASAEGAGAAAEAPWVKPVIRMLPLGMRCRPEGEQPPEELEADVLQYMQELQQRGVLGLQDGHVLGCMQEAQGLQESAVMGPMQPLQEGGVLACMHEVHQDEGARSSCMQEARKPQHVLML